MTRVAMGGAFYASHGSRIVPTRAYIVLLINFPVSTAHARQHRCPMRRGNSSKENQRRRQPAASCSLYSCLLVLISAPAGKSPGQPSCSLRAPFPCHMAPAAHPMFSTADWPSSGCQQHPSRDWHRSRPKRPDSTGQNPHRAPHLFQPDAQFGESPETPPLGVPVKYDDKLF